MEEIAAALGDRARWRIVELLAERPRTVGELAELAGLRQPQTTKHLQTLARAGVVAVVPLGQRRVYALETEPLRAFGLRLQALVESTEAHAGDRDVLERYRAAIEADTVLAKADRWADGRGFTFERVLAGTPYAVWRHWTEPELLANWWAPPSLTVVECLLEPAAGGRVVLVYGDADGGRYRSEGVVRRAENARRLSFGLSVLDAESAISFSADYDLSLAAVPDGTRLRLDVSISETTVDAVPYIAGIETGWTQVLDNLTERIKEEGTPR
ncbi:metalloregulator ArsR/SmtB family transcription factor [Kribbella sp. NPDC051770]|uniref:metalloregulator ArsR/SmtB family transcription factor n=1 Tax=Kribbella sp. NPDC051770 TaxID=3155413 RepID=UPI00342AE33F